MARYTKEILTTVNQSTTSVVTVTESERTTRSINTNLLQNWEIKNAVAHLNELEQVSTAVGNIEGKYGKMKNIINVSDVNCAET